MQEARRRRSPAAGRVAAVAAGLVLVLLGGCTAGDGSGSAGAAPSATAGTSPAATPSPARTATPTPTTAPTTPPAPSPSTEPTPEPTPEPTATPEPTPAPTETAPPPAAGPTAPPEPEMLQRGAEGERVVALQQRLVDLGYFLPAVDGAFGYATTQAVWALQKAAGIGRDGVVGPATQAALDQGVRPQARSGSGHVIEIDLDRQLLLAVDDGQVVRVVNASSGNGERFEAKGNSYRATTPRGTFAVGRQVDANYASGLELGDMWRPKFFTGGIAVHGSGSIPPYPASHGCVRVSNAAMNWIWDTWTAPRGTTVVVY